MPNCEQDLLLNGKGYISSQIMQSANSEPKLSLLTSDSKKLVVNTIVIHY